MADKWHSPVARTCETCGALFAVQYQTTRRPGCGRYCSRKCNPRMKEIARGNIKRVIGATREIVNVQCGGCGREFQTRVRNIARGGGRYCSRACNPAYARRYEPSEKHRRYRLMRNYGLSSAEFDRMETAQQNRCAICRSFPGNPHGVLFVDHCHLTDRVRGLLCNNCNTAIGLLRDDPVIAAKLAAYLLKHNPDEADGLLAISILQQALPIANRMGEQ